MASIENRFYFSAQDFEHGVEIREVTVEGLPLLTGTVLGMKMKMAYLMLIRTSLLIFPSKYMEAE